MTIPEINLLVEYENGDSVCIDSVKIVKIVGGETTKQDIYELPELEEVLKKFVS